VPDPVTAPTADDLAREYVEAVSERKYPGSLPNLAALDGFKAGYAAGFAAAITRAGVHVVEMEVLDPPEPISPDRARK
jgi:hypothetical protein